MDKHTGNIPVCDSKFYTNSPGRLERLIREAYIYGEYLDDDRVIEYEFNYCIGEVGAFAGRSKRLKTNTMRLCLKRFHNNTRFIATAYPY